MLNDLQASLINFYRTARTILSTRNDKNLSSAKVARKSLVATETSEVELVHDNQSILRQVCIF
jgi:hypothetical protein